MNPRYIALHTIENRKLVKSVASKGKISEYFGINVFDLKAMEQYLSGETFTKILEVMENKSRMDLPLADQAANGMKAWALGKGATHFTHWFQPMTGQTAQKHDSFFTLRNGRAIEEFKGTALIQQGPDASDFPTGGLRTTFEARGYTAWDPSSPAFIMEIGNGKTLCIPTTFVSYTGEALDYKAPLLKSIQFLDEAAVPVCNYFDRFVTRVIPMLGCEQEFFLVDEAFVKCRPDLLLAKRTLVGADSPKGQESHFHYFGAIPDRVYAFMLDLDQECHKLGIPVRTRHNEVGSGQFEIVPEFEELNVCIDHNLLMMDLMGRVAKKHGLSVILHEKPFHHVSGSAKHNNWSLRTDTGKNVLAPADTPRKNLLFLTFLINTIKAIHDNTEVLRACIASAGNDLRLGRGGAPPNIISVFIGKRLREVLEDIETRGDEWIHDEGMKQELKMEIHNKIPELLKDNTDENRTSPIAFTGDKFELRQVGSSHNPASPMIVMNTIVGAQLIAFRKEVEDEIKNSGMKKDGAILSVLKKLIGECKVILYEGDNYDPKWKKEMASKGLTAADNTPEALLTYTGSKAKELFARSGVLNHTELESRRENLLNKYCHEIQTEAMVLLEMVKTTILPAVFEYQTRLANSIQAISDLPGKKGDISSQQQILNILDENSSALLDLHTELANEVKKVTGIENKQEKSESYCHKVRPLLERIREKAAILESQMDDRIWPLPKLREMLFLG